MLGRVAETSSDYETLIHSSPCTEDNAQNCKCSKYTIALL